MTDPIRRLIMKHATAGEIQDMAVSEGMRTMYQDGLNKCLQGTTTLEEVAGTQESFAVVEYKAVAPSGETVRGTMKASVELVVRSCKRAIFHYRQKKPVPEASAWAPCG
jgi:hypothetical protein